MQERPETGEDIKGEEAPDVSSLVKEEKSPGRKRADIAPVTKSANPKRVMKEKEAAEFIIQELPKVDDAKLKRTKKKLVEARQELEKKSQKLREVKLELMKTKEALALEKEAHAMLRGKIQVMETMLEKS